MHLAELNLPLQVLKIIGVYRSEDSGSTLRDKLFSLWTLIVLTWMSSFVFCFFLQTCQSTNFNELNEALSFLLTMSVACSQALYFCFAGNRLRNLHRMLREERCLPRDEAEVAILVAHKNFRKRVDWGYFGFVYGTSTMIVLAPMSGWRDRALPVNIYWPFSVDNFKNYVVAYFYQIGAFLFCASCGFACTLVIVGFMSDASCQLAILKDRFQKLPDVIREKTFGKLAMERKLIREYVQHHKHIYDIAARYVETFNLVIFYQLFVTTTDITMTVYYMTLLEPSDVAFINSFMFVVSILLQFFLYCYFSNEITLESRNFGLALFTTDWTELSLDSQLSIKFIIHRSAFPIVISCFGFFTLSLEMFGKILKLSYSIFNLLSKKSM